MVDRPTMPSCKALSLLRTVVDWLEFNVPFQHKYGYIRDDIKDSERTKSKMLIFFMALIFALILTTFGVSLSVE